MLSIGTEPDSIEIDAFDLGAHDTQVEWVLALQVFKKWVLLSKLVQGRSLLFLEKRSVGVLHCEERYCSN